VLSESEHHRLPVEAEEDVGALRRAVARMAADRRALRPGVAELVATELGTNLLRHALPGGYVLARRAGDGIELLSVDRGPGMTAAALAPPAGTAPSAASARPGGRGLNAGLAVIRRNAAEFDWYSTLNGTVVYVRLGAPEPDLHPGWRVGGVNVPLGGDGESGDAWAVTPAGHRGPRHTLPPLFGGPHEPKNTPTTASGEHRGPIPTPTPTSPPSERPRPSRPLAALVVDGLGHGPHAAAAARAAVGVFERVPVTDLDALLRRAHEAMRSTRGGVLGACLIDPGRGELAYAAVGNITGRAVTRGRSVHLLDRPGTLGTQLPVPSVRLQRCPWEPGSTLVLVSDGIRSGWSLDGHPRLLERHPAIVAAVLHRDYGRPTDDATVLVVHCAGGMP
jgi:anti-sigma regulatory factor (Ser/Thr protein kinase)